MSYDNRQQVMAAPRLPGSSQGRPANASASAVSRGLPGDSRPAKRPRLSPVKSRRDTAGFHQRTEHGQGSARGKENVRPQQSTSHTSAQNITKAEQAMMDELLAGLDASAFDLSPTKSQTRPASQSKGGREDRSIKTEQQSPLRARTTNAPPSLDRGCALASPVKGATPRSSPIRRPTLLSVKVELEDSKPSCDRKPGVMAPEDELFEGMDDLCDFDFGDLSAFEEDLYQAPPPTVKYPISHPNVPKPPDGYTSIPWLRCSVEYVFEGLRFMGGILPARTIMDQMVGSSGAGVPSGKTLVCKTPKDHILRIVHLKEAWMMAPIKPGDTINLITPDISSNPLTISSKCASSFLILHPDLMLTMTSIANAMPCPRRPILNSLIKTSGAQSKAVVYGNLLHGLLQSSLQEQDFTPGGTHERLEGMLKREEVRLDVWGAGLNVRDVSMELGDRARADFERFGGKWVGPKPTDEGELHSMPGESQELLCISGLHEVEEDIWSPKWGLKGKVDASVQAAVVRKVDNASNKAKRSVFAPKSAAVDEVAETVAPLEIKTGRAVGLMAHRAQTMLYTLLMEDRYGIPVPSGLLYYSQLDTILRVEARTNEIRSLIMARNELASHLNKKRKIRRAPKVQDDGAANAATQSSQPIVSQIGEIGDIEDSFLPPTLDDERECQNCYAKDACMLYRKAVDKTPVVSNDPIGILYEETVGNMSEADTAFFRKWETLLTLEEQDMGRFKSQLWTMSAEEREENGRCFANMVIDGYSNDIGKSLAKIHRHAYTFVRAPTSTADSTQSGKNKASLLSGHIATGDPVSLSIEPDLFALTRGYVLNLTSASVTVGVQYAIEPSALLQRTKYRHPTRQLAQLSLANATEEAETQKSRVVFRIDKDEMSGGVARMRNNLAQLFLPGGNDKLRRIVVDHVAPRFSSSSTNDTSITAAGGDDFDFFASQGPLASLPDVPAPESFNADQQLAMQRVLTGRDYALILGMPGTGKTTTIAEIIKAIVGRGQTVLLASYTHSAVDTILRKLVNEDLNMLRLGNVDKVHPDVQHLTLEAMNASTSMGELGERLMGPPVVACTCLGIDQFDYCIIDEASQITLPTALGPLRFADKFVLVGDHYQLPPIVKNHDARKAGLDVSLFKLLSEKRPESVTSLTFQYRMNEDIMALSNKLIYEGRLKCGNEEVARQALKFNRPVKLEVEAKMEVKAEVREGGPRCGHEEAACWIGDLMRDDVKAVFVDTDGVPARDSRIGDLVQNPTEALLAHQFIGALTEAGVKQDDIAVITPYRQQIKLLTSVFADLPRVEILTADKSQGRDKDVVVISLVRSNESGNIGELLRDWRRINVSFTRAKKKLVIFGSRTTLSQDKLLGDFFELMREKNWIYRLPVNAHRAPGHAGGGLISAPSAGKQESI